VTIAATMTAMVIVAKTTTKTTTTITVKAVLARTGNTLSEPGGRIAPSRLFV